jgi:uncharacterized membrane protein
MALIVLALAALLYLRGYRGQAKLLAAVACVWAAVTLGIVMPELRGGGGSDLTERYDYLYADVKAVNAAPLVVLRAATHLLRHTLPAVIELLLSTAFLPVLTPLSLLAAAPSIVASGLSSHPEQARLGLHYSVPSQALLWVGALLGLEKLRTRRCHLKRLILPAPAVAAAGVLIFCLAGFLTSSPYLRHDDRPAPAHAEALSAALALVPSEASVSAQTAILPHLSRRRYVFEFPEIRGAEFVIIDRRLHVSSQSILGGYHERLALLESFDYELHFDREGVQVWRLR